MVIRIKWNNKEERDIHRELKRNAKSPINKALSKAKGESSYEKMNKERKSQGYKTKSDRSSKGLYDFLDKYR